MVKERYNQRIVAGGQVSSLVGSALSNTTEKESFDTLLSRQLASDPSEYVRVNADVEWDMFCTEKKGL